MPSVLVKINEGVAHIRFNKPQRLNAADAEMAQSLRDAVRELVLAADVRVAVLSGEGRAFMAGGDLSAFHTDMPHAPETARRIMDPLHEAVSLLAEAPWPVIASVHGAVAGAGLSLTLGADLAIAAEGSKFVPAYSLIATSQDGGGSWALPRLVGLKCALEIALLSDPFDAAKALKLGIVNRVVGIAELEDQTNALARRLAQGPTQAYRHIKRLLRHSLQATLSEQLAAEKESFSACAATTDFAEGIAAFIEKRQAQFSGR